MRSLRPLALVAFLLAVGTGCPTPARAVAETPEPPKPTRPDGKAACRRGGCSGEVCADTSPDQPVNTLCMYLPIYECWQAAACERQPGGGCGFTVTPEVARCLAKHDKQPPK